MTPEEIEIERHRLSVLDKGVSICISAYKAVDTIKDTLDSVISQTWFKNHVNWEVLLGIDGCEETLEYVKTIMNNYKNLRVFMMNSNKGTYITSNTLMSIAKYDYLIRFDADDLMLYNYVEEMMTAEKGDIYRFYFRHFDPAKHKADVKILAIGQHGMTKEFFKKYGGYRPWICAADKELLERTKNLCTEVFLSNTHLIRKTIPTSLTNAKETKYPSSEIRKQYHEFMDNEVINCEEDAIITTVVNEYEEITSDIFEFDKDEYMQNVKPIEEYFYKGPRIKRISDIGSPTFPVKVQRKIIRANKVRNGVKTPVVKKINANKVNFI